MDWLSRYALGETDDPAGLSPLTPETFGATIFGKLATRCADGFNARLELWRAAFQRDLNACRSPEEVSTALQNARVRARALDALATSTLLYAELSDALSDALTKTLQAADDALQTAARSNGLAGESLLRVVRTAGIAAPARLKLGDEPAVRTGSGPRGILLSGSKARG